jgi:DNA-binding PadR family transcriptional regulator
MARNAAAPSKMEILVLTALARTPMHGYELKLELQYKHVQWWAKCEHGHLYAALARLERGKYIRRIARPGGRSTQRVYTVTAAGRRRVTAALVDLGGQPDATYFDVDMFLSACHLLDRDAALAILADRVAATRRKLAEANQIEKAMRGHVPAAGRLIMEHRIQYLDSEVRFLERCVATLRAEPTWESFLRGTTIGEFVETTRVPLER